MIPVGAPTISFSPSWPALANAFLSRPAFQSSFRAKPTAHSIAAEDESPAPTGTSESIKISKPWV